MSFEEISAVPKYYKYPEMEPGQIICEGWYVAKGDGKFGHYYEIVDANGVKHILNKAGHLDYYMQDMEKESYIRVTYMGKEKLTKGLMSGKDVNKFKVEKDKSRFGKREHAGFAEVAPEVVTTPSEEDSLPF